MNIVINAVLFHSQPRGVGRYVNNLLPALADLDKENNYFVYYGKWMKDYSFLKIKQNNFTFIELDIPNSKIRRNWFLAWKLPELCKKFNPDIFFLIDTQAILKKPCKIVSTIHDLAEFENKFKYSKFQALLRRIIVKKQAKLSDKIITVSNYSKESLIKHLKINGDKIHVIYNSVNLDKFKPDIAEPQKYFLFVGEIEVSKGLTTLLKAFNAMESKYKNDFHIEVVGECGNDYENVKKYITENGLTEKVNFNGYLGDLRLTNIYKYAYAFVFPSLFEGFGLPVIEAMASGVPVISSDSSSLPEVGGDAVLLFKTNDYRELCLQLTKIIENKDLRDAMISKGKLQVKKIIEKNDIAKDTLDLLVDSH